MLRRPRPPVDQALPVLRRRATALLAAQPPRLRAFVRIVPLLLSARFRRPSLESEPPGLLLPPRRRRWGKLCERLDLPPPAGWYATAHPLVRSVVLAPRPDGQLELVVVPLDGLTPHQQRRLELRLEALVALAARHAPTLDVRLGEANTLTPSLFAWAAVIAGDVPPISPQALDWFDVLSRASTPLLRAVALLVPRDAPQPLEVLRGGQSSGRPLAFLAQWSGLAVVRDLDALRDKDLSPTELGGLATQLRSAALRALRSLPVEERREAHRLVRSALLGSRFPPALRPLLERTLARTRAQEVQREGGWQLELGGLVLVRAPSLDQLRARAVAESPVLAKEGTVWPKVGAMLKAADGRARALALIEPGFLRHLLVLVPRSGRPRAHRVEASAFLKQLLAWRRSEITVDLVPSPGCDPTLLSRASQLLKLQLEPSGLVAWELDGRVLLVSGAQSRSMPVDVVLRRPRTLTWVPQRADVSRCLRRPYATGLPTVHAVAVPDDDEHVALFAIDSSGAMFREQVAATALAATLADYREVLRHTDPPTLVATSVHPSLDALSGLRSESGPALKLEVELVGGGEQVAFEGERFGSGAALGWAALAEAVLSHWPPGTSAPLSISRVRTSSPPGASISPLWLLAARSRVLRRLDTHLRRISRLLAVA